MQIYNFSKKDVKRLNVNLINNAYGNIELVYI